MTNNEYLTNRINEYLSNGGLFNPEHMNHEEVRNLLMEIRDNIVKKEKTVGYSVKPVIHDI
jgi:hypothetical protein